MLLLYFFEHTIIINFSIVVFISVLHQLLDIVLSDALSGRLQHALQLVQVNVAVSVPSNISNISITSSGEVVVIFPSCLIRRLLYFEFSYMQFLREKREEGKLY